MKKTVVFGSSGFIGRSVVKAIQADGGKVISIGRVRSGSLPGVQNSESVFFQDFNEKELREYLDWSEVDCVINLSAAGVMARAPLSEQLRINTFFPALLGVIAAEYSVPLIAIGTCSEYGDTEDESEEFSGEGPYAVSKILSSNVLEKLSVETGLSGMYLRLFNVFGHGEPPHRLLPTILTAADSETPIIMSEGSQVRDFVYIDDAVEAILAARRTVVAASPENFDFADVCTGVGTSVRDFAKLVVKLRGCPDALLSFGSIPMRENETKMSIGKPQRLKELTGWAPNRSLEDSISDALMYWDSGWKS